MINYLCYIKRYDMNNLAYIVRTLCEMKGIKMKELAEKMEISPVSLSRTIAKNTPKPSTFTKLGNAFGISPDVLENMYKSIDASSMPRLIIPHDASSSEDEGQIAARYYYKGKTLYAASIQDMKDITNVLSMLESMTDTEQYDSTLSLLVKQYGTLRY